VELRPFGGRQEDLVAPRRWCGVRLAAAVAFLGVAARRAMVSLLRPRVQGPLARRHCQPHGGAFGMRRGPAMEAPLLGVEVRAVSPSSMEEGEKAQSVALATKSLGTLWL
jgi:hypothetical protein